VPVPGETNLFAGLLLSAVLLDILYSDHLSFVYNYFFKVFILIALYFYVSHFSFG